MKEGQNCNYEKKKLPINLQRGHQLKKKRKKEKKKK
jgi:hypothetical protein